jgi:hypothetical protein
MFEYKKAFMGCLAALITWPGVASADMVTDWSLITTQAVVTKGGRAGAVEFAIVHAAMFDAVNAVERRYEPYVVDRAAQGRGASPEAAAAAAAHKALVGLFPEQAASLDAAYANSLAALPNDARKTRGIALGEDVATATLVARAGDGRDLPVPAYTFGSGPGVYRPTTPFPPTGQPINTFLGNIAPLVMMSAGQFRAYGPPGLTSARFTRDIAEVREWGSLSSTLRTEAQAEIARFHTENPNQFWGRNLSNFVASRDMGIARSARLMTLFAFAQADAAIACFESKYTYSFWRPSTAIQQTDPSWLPFLNTPPHPEYPAAHGCIAGAVVQTMEEFFGKARVSFTFNSTVTGMTHSYACPDDLVEEIANARVWGGMHFRGSVNHGVALGRAVGRWDARHALLPRR